MPPKPEVTVDFDPVGEPDTLNELGQLVVAIEPAPVFLRRIDQLEHHGERRLIREAALRADRAVPHGGKGALAAQMSIRGKGTPRRSCRSRSSRPIISPPPLYSLPFRGVVSVAR